MRTFDVPGTPSWSRLKGSNQQVELEWSLPSDGGQPIQGYTVTVAPGGRVINTTQRSAVVTGLTNGQNYTFKLVATNAVGDSTANTSSSVRVAAVPSAPQNVTVVPYSGAVLVQWTAPANNGGALITGYVITTHPTGTSQSASASSTSIDLSGLTHGATYSFSVAAQNSSGVGAFATTASVTLPSPPSAPINLTGIYHQGQLELDWQPPANDGGRPITGYRLTSAPAGVDQSFPPSPTVARLSGLPADTTYTFTLTARNAVGAGPAITSAPILLREQPRAPTDVRVHSTPAGAVVRWNPASAPATDPITEYIVTASPGGGSLTVPANARVATLPGLTSGTTYLFQVKARNGAGEGRPSAPMYHRHVVPLACETPSFTPVSQFAYPTGGQFVGAGDFNGDSRQDVLVGNLFDISVLASGPGRSFTRLANSASAGNSLSSAAPVVADFNGDGKLDVAAILDTDGSYTSGGFTVYLGRGTGTFQAPLSTPLGVNVTSSFNCLTARDFNSDGMLDLLAHVHLGRTLLYRGKGDGTFYITPTTTSLAPAEGGLPQLVIYKRLPGGGFAPAERYDEVRYQAELIAVDLNEDGRFDLVSTERFTASKIILSLWLNLGSGRFAPRVSAEVTANYEVKTLLSADLDRDGHLDLALLRPGNPDLDKGEVYVLWGRGDGTFSGQTTFTGEYTHRALGRADLDGQGNVGLLIDRGEVGLLTFDAARQPTLTPQHSLGIRAGDGIYTADFNADGHMDVFSFNALEGRVVMQSSPNTFALGARPGWGLTAQDGLIADWNADGLPDLAFTSVNAKAATLVLNVCLPP
ncbi:fibronectin type III domain-containing protein [Pyxidicoccus sp. 3LG]